MKIPDFQKFPKIPRLNRSIIITEKIDGTNAQILVTEDGRVIPGSRNRYLLNGSENFGFAAWTAEHEEELRQLGPGLHFGEWWGQKIARKYGLDHRRFSLFNVRRWIGKWQSQFPYAENAMVPPLCCHVVPVLQHSLTPDTWEIAKVCQGLKKYGSRAAPGFMNPEGVVIYHTAGDVLFKVTLENDAEWKGPKDAPAECRR